MDWTAPSAPKYLVRLWVSIMDFFYHGEHG
jgi:hypothetical protein